MVNESRHPTLSSHLLWEAQKFLPYPNTSRRTAAWLRLQKNFDAKIREFGEWRKTFTPAPSTQLFGSDTAFLDDLYCRDLLQRIPEFVERIQRLSSLTLASIPDPDSAAYLVEAANCYIVGYPLAAVALARAAMEVPLRKNAETIVGKQLAYATDLKEVIDDYCARRGRLLSAQGKERAHQVRRAANDILHQPERRGIDVVPILEAARTVILELSQHAARGAGPSNSPLHRTGARIGRSGR